MAKYRLAEKAFFAPMLLPEGTIIEYNGQPGPHMEPLDDEAREIMASYYARYPEASLSPVEQLPGTVEVPLVSVVSTPEAGTVGVVDLTGGSLADPGKASPGPTDGGIVIDAKAK